MDRDSRLLFLSATFARLSITMSRIGTRFPRCWWRWWRRRSAHEKNGGKGVSKITLYAPIGDACAVFRVGKMPEQKNYTGDRRTTSEWTARMERRRPDNGRTDRRIMLRLCVCVFVCDACRHTIRHKDVTRSRVTRSFWGYMLRGPENEDKKPPGRSNPVDTSLDDRRLEWRWWDGGSCVQSEWRRTWVNCCAVLFFNVRREKNVRILLTDKSSRNVW